MSSHPANILVVDDERPLADLYAEWLESEYRVSSAYGGEAALAQVSAETDVVLLDRRMPDLSGDDVLAEIRSQELPCQVAMVTAVEPDFDIVEMGFDDYIVKPLDREELLDLVRELLTLEDLGSGAKQYHSHTAKQTVLENQKNDQELRSNSRYNELSDGIEAYEQVIVALAEEAIGAAKQQQLSSGNKDKRDELREWERKLESLDPDDPLYRVAHERVEELKSNLGTEQNQGRQQFLEAVSKDFVAEGHWLHSTVRRALNLVIHGRDRERFVINRRPLTDDTELNAASKFELSQEVRELAKSELDSPA